MSNNKTTSAVEILLGSHVMSRDDDMEEALEELSRLGNGSYPGNSIGNVIAQKALSFDPFNQ
jgi:hypothetical protein